MSASRTWASSLQLEDQWKACCLASFGDDVRWFWFDSHWYWQELGAFYRWDFVRVAVGVARFRAAKGRMPVTLDEAGVAEILSRPVTIKSDRIAAKLCPEGPDVSSFARQLDQVEWVIRPR